MLNVDEITRDYPERLRGFKENILKEYLQHRILDIVFGSKYADGLVFMGGTAIRILHGGPRFSEDLDFDNRGLGVADFKALSDHIDKELSLEGYEVLSKTDPDYEYLRQRADIGDKGELVDALRRRSAKLDMQALARDVEPFLFDPSQKDRVSRFDDWLATL